MSREKVELETSSDPLFGNSFRDADVDDDTIIEQDNAQYLSSGGNNNGDNDKTNDNEVKYEESLTIRAEDESR